MNKPMVTVENVSEGGEWPDLACLYEYVNHGDDPGECMTGGACPICTLNDEIARREQDGRTEHDIV